MQNQSQETFQSANTRNIEALEKLTYKYVRSLISVSEEPFQWSTKSSERPLSLDEEVKRLRAEADYFNNQIDQSDQCMAVLRRALNRARLNKANQSMRLRAHRSTLEYVMVLRGTKLPKLPDEILSMICEQYRLAEEESDWKEKYFRINTGPGRYSWEKCGPGEICGIICGRHKSISVSLDEQSLRDKISQDNVAGLNVTSPTNFFSQTLPGANSHSWQSLDTALEFGDRWGRLSIDEDDIDAVDSVLRRCESVLPSLIVLDITEKESWMDEISQGRILARFIPEIRRPRLQDAKVPLGYVLHSGWLFECLTCLNLCLPAKLDQPSRLVDCLEGLTELRHLTLRAYAQFDVESYAAKTVAFMPKLVELELMFDKFDTDMLASMLHTFSCPNLKKYVTHFIPRLNPMRHPPSEFVYDLRAVVDAKPVRYPIGYPPSDVWALLDGRFPSLQHFEIGNYAESWCDHAAEQHARDLISVLTEPTNADGHWLFPQLSGLTLPMTSDDGLRCRLYSGLVPLAIARAGQGSVSDINSVAMYGDYAFDTDDETVEALGFYIPNLYII